MRTDSKTTYPSVISIVVATDDGFALPTCTLISSIAASANSGRSFDIRILDGGMSDKIRSKMYKSLNHITRWSDNRNVKISTSITKPNANSIPSFNIKKSVTISAYIRLLIPSIITDVDRCIYMDGDIIVRHDMLSIWEHDLNGNPAAAVVNYSNPTIGGAIPNWKSRLGGKLDPSNAYMNSGVLLMDLDKWRRDKIGSMIIHDITQNGDKYIFNDQCGINAILSSHWSNLPKQWNVQLGSGHLRDTMKSIDNVYAGHFTTSTKPWNKWRQKLSPVPATYVALRQEWFDAALQTGWHSSLEWYVYRAKIAADDAFRANRHRLGRFRREMAHRILECLTP